ncbi:transmembrane protein 244 [Ailuropoda melanoleuca]|uniref:transmembrane protein 244 n=1 Tax=Ailuropoda melanoleuca TaxID=9646 RepID=UPI0009481255|nr:transmembrane protein 244 [Ailuropoda melanoleuca]
MESQRWSQYCQPSYTSQTSLETGRRVEGVMQLGHSGATKALKPGTYHLHIVVVLVLQNLLICVILLYTVYYAVLGVCCMMLKVYELDVLAPFDFKTNPSWLNTNYKVLLVSTQVTYFVCGLLSVLVVEEWVWDYAISVTILHVVITSTVMLEFPLTSHWWAALGSGLISMICGGQAFAYCLFKDNFIYPDLDEF